ncbi:MAG: outer membrane protein assembly factor BamE [Alphaproteobacteria bacterium]
MTIDRSWRQRLTVLAAAIVVTGGVAACAGPNLGMQEVSYGYNLDKDRLAQIQAGKSTKQQVLGVLGTPSSVAAFDPNTWYYISKRTDQFAFMAPRTVDQNVVMLRFNQQNVVTEVKELTLQDAGKTAMADKETPTRAKEPGLLRSLYQTVVSGPVGALGSGATGRGFER